MLLNRFLLLLLVSFPLFCFSQASITGKWNRKHDGTIRLFTIKEGSLHEIATAQSGKSGEFGFLFYPEEGFYVIGGSDNTQTTGKYTFYFKKNDYLNVTVTDTSYVLSGKNSPENLEMEKWHNMVVGIERQSIYYRVTKSSYLSFFPMFEDVERKSKLYKPAKTGNRVFDEKFSTQRELDLLYYATDFVSIPKRLRPRETDLIGYYKELNPEKYTSDTRLMNYAAGQSALTSMLFVSNWLKRGFTKAFNFEPTLAEIPNDTMRGEVALFYIKYARDFTEFIEREERLNKYFVTTSQKEREKAFKYKLAGNTTKRGETAPVFTCEDITGKKVTLSDFKGKVVMIDFWATWCGPCKAEIPHLKTLEEYFPGQDVVFVSISMDAVKDQEKWKKFVTDEGLGGVQLFGGRYLTELRDMYDIKTIPRFMVIDKKGNLVSSKAPKPSGGKELRNLLASEAKK